MSTYCDNIVAKNAKTGDELHNVQLFVKYISSPELCVTMHVEQVFILVIKDRNSQGLEPSDLYIVQNVPIALIKCFRGKGCNEDYN